MKKVLLINGSPHQEGCTFTALAEIERALKKHGIESDFLYLGKKPLAGCTDCGVCARTGKCAVNDAVNETISRLDEYDALVAGSPVYYGGPSGQICCFLDRLCFAGGRRLAGKLAASVVSCRRGGATSAFQRLNQYFAMNNMFLVGSQYWNQVHGFTPDDVRKDEEGLQTMRTLAENMAWMMKNMEAGKNAGVKPPQYEPVIMTHFIR